MRTDRRRVRLAGFILSLLPALVGHAQTAPSDTVEQLHRAMAQGDRAAASATLAPDVTIFESGEVERSRDDYLAHHFESDAKFARTVARRVVRRGERLAGDMAVVTAETEASGRYDGKPIRSFGVETAVLRQVEGQWQIVHLHWSSRTMKP